LGRWRVEWLCTKTDNLIEVYYGPFFKGYYQLLEEPFCQVCAHSNVTTEECTWHHSLNWVDRIYAMGSYKPFVNSEEEDLLSYHIRGLKMWSTRAQPLGKGMSVTAQNRYRQLLDSDFIVPVPLHSKKLEERGYNQALELSNVISRELGIVVLEVLEKTADLDMRPLNWQERRETVEGLYSVEEAVTDEVGGQSVILIDDVVTTGFTVAECSKLLKGLGATSVNVFAAGRTVPETERDA